MLHLKGLEVVSPSKRTLVSFYSNMFYVLGLVGFSGLAYAIPDWRLMALATSVPFIVYYVYILYESGFSKKKLFALDF